jgi:hypothetical protein
MVFHGVTAGMNGCNYGKVFKEGAGIRKKSDA